MDNSYISAPQQFEHMDGNSIDFKKTFDLNGTSNDDMLRLYLRKAGLSDEIECLTPEQRRAFIYDIIKSNKMPGYWMPSTMKGNVSVHTQQQQPATRPAPAPPIRNETNTVLPELRNETATPTINYATMKTSSSTDSLKSMSKSSPLMPQRFSRPKNVPSSPTTIVKGRSGVKYEISGPINFTHVSGDMTRDMTKKAFDLSMTMNDNVLKKYLIERGIKDEEIAGISKQDLIRKIVQSRYTWMPPGHNEVIRESRPPTLRLVSSYSSFSSSTFSSSPPSTPQLTTSNSVEEENGADFSNFTLVTSRFADPSQFPSPNSIFSQATEAIEPEVSIRVPKAPPQKIRPAPPPRKPKSQMEHVSVPPPPSSITATPNTLNTYHSKLETETETRSPDNSEEYRGHETVDKLYNYEGVPTPPPPPPPPPPLPSADDFASNATEPIYSQPKKRNDETSLPPPPPPPLMTNSNAKTVVSPKLVEEVKSQDPRDDFLASIRKGVTLKKVEKKGFTVAGGLRPRSKLTAANFTPLKKPISTAPPPPKTTTQRTSLYNSLPLTSSNRSTLAPPPPPPMPKASVNNSMQIGVNNGSAPLPPPPPPPPIPAQFNEESIKSTANSSSVNRNPVSIVNSGDSRDALLESIRNGVNLKKVNQKGATISGTKPRAEQKPPVTDFLSELKMGITLRKVKNSNDNLHDNDPDESEA